jgi:hypothetical protein
MDQTGNDDSTDPLTREHISYISERVRKKAQWLTKFYDVKVSDVTEAYLDEIARQWFMNNSCLETCDKASAFLDLATLKRQKLLWQNVDAYGAKTILQSDIATPYSWLIRKSSAHSDNRMENSDVFTISFKMANGEVNNQRYVFVHGVGVYMVNTSTSLLTFRQLCQRLNTGQNGPEQPVAPHFLTPIDAIQSWINCGNSLKYLIRSN